MFWHSAAVMFLRSCYRKKDGKDHRYFSIVENRRMGSDQTVQRTVLYLGEINDQQQAAWRKTLAVFDEQQQHYTNLSLFPDDREIPADAIDSPAGESQRAGVEAATHLRQLLAGLRTLAPVGPGSVLGGTPQGIT